MEFKADAGVYTPEGQVVGHVDRVVLNPQTKAVTHIVVRQGLFFVEGKVVPLNLVRSADEERVVLRAAAGDLEHLPAFEEAHYVPLTDEEAQAAAYAEGLAAPLYWYPPMGGWLVHDYVPPYGMEIEQNIPQHTVAVRHGARVMTADDKDVGYVEQVFIAPESHRATYFMIAHGLLAKTKKLIPATWVRRMTEDEVQLSIGAGVIDGLQEYLPA